MQEQELTSLRVLKWLHDLHADPKETILTIQDIDHTRNSARGHLMAWSEKKAMQEDLQELTDSSNLKQKEYGTVIISEANEGGLEQLLKVSSRVALQRYFDKTECIFF